MRPLVLRAVVMITIMQFFGWRSNTVVELRTQDVRVKGEELLVYSCAFKTIGPGGHPMGTLKLSKLPWLFAAIKFYLTIAPSPKLFG